MSNIVKEKKGENMNAQKKWQGEKNHRERKLKIKNTLQKNALHNCMKINLKPGWNAFLGKHNLPKLTIGKTGNLKTYCCQESYPSRKKAPGSDNLTEKVSKPWKSKYFQWDVYVPEHRKRRKHPILLIRRVQIDTKRL